MDPATIAAVSAIAAGIQVGTSVAGAASQNRAIKKSQTQAQQAAAVRSRQLSQQAAVEMMKREQESQRVKAAIRAAAAGAGAGFEGSSFAQLSTQAEIDRTVNQQIADTDLGFTLNRVSSDLSANLSSLESQRQNMLVAGLTGAAQGVQTGLNFYSGFSAIFPPEPVKP
jgi:hypothetical protein